MAAWRLQCWECGRAFHGRADARYCCDACRQKAHRDRTRRRAADQAVPTTALSRAVAQARQARETARATRARAEAARRATVCNRHHDGPSAR